MKKVRTRYAPSPTGYLHIGGARTALFAYLFAKHNNGDFIVRIEDTDIARNVEGGEKSQLENLSWLGIIPDESPIKPLSKYGKYRQSEKLERYNSLVEQLLASGKAYKAYDNSQELIAQRDEQNKKGIFSFRYDKNWLKLSSQEQAKRETEGQFSVRLALPKNKVYEWNDIVRGKISINSDDIGDWVIKKSDGYPTYNFAVVVDDHDMEISHVLRGEEHITNTPKQLAVYEAFGWENPSFGHLTIITNMAGEKLSKRDFSVKQFIEDYKNEGFLPQAIFNFLTLLGWTAHDASEIMTKEEIIAKFDPARLSKSPSKFDIQKMEWFSKQYFKNSANEWLISKLNTNKSVQWMEIFVDTYKQNAVTLNDLKSAFNIYQNPKQNLPQVEIDVELVNVFKEQLQNNNFSIDGIQNAINNTKSITNKTGKNLFMPIRISATFEQHGPELAKAIYLFGKDLIMARLDKWK